MACDIVSLRDPWRIPSTEVRSVALRCRPWSVRNSRGLQDSHALQPLQL